MKRPVALSIVFLIIFSGCAFFAHNKDDESAEELAWNGMEEFQSGKYESSIEHFEKLKDWFPYSKYAILAELKLADAYYRLGRYEDAIFAYEEFENLHPRNEKVPYVIYQTGLCYFERMDTWDRDQKITRKALDTFTRLQRQFPDDAYARKAGEHINTCLKSLAMHDFQVGMFYYRSRHYKAALHRFESVIAKYPDVGIHNRALQYIAKCRRSMADGARQAD